ncbi:hypothetical protein [Candidatus Pantoea multigeneris]|uniref:Uncharacterized protein n=1 Tax=Candidatus Pantoea multigeneris TaxID=2608357 RepID=A0ABX0R825_9GAMM|nr:hypothetical protein [Pantoea multigeneris]NIF21237.1 hypothetical protein [Pantoea multigeneris]
MGINAVQPTITGATPPANAVGSEVVDKARQTYQQLIATLDHPALWTSRMSGALVSELAKTPLLKGRAATLIVLDRQQNIFKAVDLRNGRELDAASVNLSKSQQLIIERSEQEADGCFRVIHNDRGYVKFDRHPQGGFGIRNDPGNPAFTTPASFPFLDSLALALFSHKKSRSAMAIATHREMLRQQLRGVLQEKIAAMGPDLTNDAHTPRIIATHPKRPLTTSSLSTPGSISAPVTRPLNNAYIAATLRDDAKNAESVLPKSKKRHRVKRMIPDTLVSAGRSLKRITRAVSAGIGSLFNRHQS